MNFTSVPLEIILAAARLFNDAIQFWKIRRVSTFCFQRQLSRNPSVAGMWWCLRTLHA